MGYLVGRTRLDALESCRRSEKLDTIVPVRAVRSCSLHANDGLIPALPTCENVKFLNAAQSI